MTARLFSLLMATLIALILIALSRGIGWAAVQGDDSAPVDRWVIRACLHQPVERGCYDLGVPFESRTECRITAERVKVAMSGSRLSCQPFEVSR